MGTRLGLTPPKQFQPLTSARPMVVETALRCVGPRFSPPVFVTHADQADLLEKLLDLYNIRPHMVIREPHARNTAAAITTACLFNPDQTLLFLPSDHKIDDITTFVDTIFSVENPDHITCFGVQPTQPNTQYGYIQRAEGGDIIARFHEKPDLQTANTYYQSGHYFWNAGIFMGRAEVFLQSIKTHAPNIYRACNAAIDGDTIDADLYQTCLAQSFDRAVMEHIHDARMVTLSCGWTDLGTPEAFHSINCQAGKIA